MIRGTVKRVVFIYTRPPGKCGIATITADSILNSKLASEEGFDRNSLYAALSYFTEYDLLQ